MNKRLGYTRTCAVIPMKDLAVAKQRLSGMLSTGERRHLSLEMLLDVITTLKRVDGLDTVAVISRDPHVMDLARTWNVRVLRDTESCMNAALAVTARTLSTEGCETMLVVPGDVPLTTPAEIEKILETRDTGFPVTLVPDRRRTGTNALSCSPPTAITPCFGQHSLMRHQKAAKDAGLTSTVLELPELGLDIDVPEDVLALRARKGQSRTHDFLEAMPARTLHHGEPR